MELPDILRNLNINPGIGLENGPEIPFPDGFECDAGGPEQMEKEEFKEEEVDEAPRLIRRKSPPYPRMARREEIEGLVLVEFLVNREGKVMDIRIVKSVPRGIFDEAVRSALRGYRFRPATWKGRPVNCRCTKKFRFVLWD